MTADRPVVAEVHAGDLITGASGRLPLAVIVRCVTTRPHGRTLHLEIPGRPERTFPVRYEDDERVERWAA